MKATTLIVLLALTIQGVAQDAAADFKAINMAYANSKAMSMSVRYDVFQDWDAEEPMQSMTAEVVRDGNKTCSTLGSIESVATNDYSISVDHETQVIAVLGSSTTLPEPSMDLMVSNLETALDFCTSVDLLEDSRKLRTWKLTFPEMASQYAHATFSFNPQSNEVKRIALFYAVEQDLTGEEGAEEARPRMELTLTEQDDNPSIDRDTFSLSRFVTKEGGAWVCNSEFKDYELIDQLSTR